MDHLIHSLPTHVQLQILSKLSKCETSISSSVPVASSHLCQREQWAIEDASHLILSRLASHGYCVLDYILDPCLISQVHTHVIQLSTRDSFRRAGLGTGLTLHQNASYRSDSILFWNPSQSDASHPMHEVWNQLHHLSQSLYSHLGLDFYTKSFQVSHYEKNTWYGKHRDSSPLNPYRAITCLLYLNPDWKQEHGGQLRLYLSSDSTSSVDIEPRLGRLLIFYSDMEHQVLTSNTSRYAITLWTYTQQEPLLKNRVQEWYKKALENHRNETIFISIPSYRDPETQRTIQSLYTNAIFPDRVNVGVLYQNLPNDTFNTNYNASQSIYPYFIPTIRSMELNATDAKGPAFARAMILREFFKDEKFLLQVDSHMTFGYGWDVYLIRALDQTKNPDVSLISYYPPSYSRPDKFQLPPYLPVTMRPSHFDANGILRIISKPMETLPFESFLHQHHLIACGFMFGIAKNLVPILRDVFHPDLISGVFYGEEIVASYFLYAKGYDAYSIHDQKRAILFHLWDRSYRDTFWENTVLETKSCLGKIRSILTGSLEPTSLKNSPRTLKQFEEAIGVSFSQCVVHNTF